MIPFYYPASRVSPVRRGGFKTLTSLGVPPRTNSKAYGSSPNIINRANEEKDFAPVACVVSWLEPQSILRSARGFPQSRGHAKIRQGRPQPQGLYRQT